ncbi:MAG: bifunctional diaminohydroxyphosphoribosylaminopyrimidine deaminase/5-amino-6-(5-phosphoribosylamino)uracil reductase RibD [Burkholderiaceae bacterium]
MHQSASNTNQLINLALAQAQLACLVSDPNPRVGCVIVSSQGQILGQGHTQATGLAHAEVMALQAASTAGHEVRGAVAYVTLEPCSHFGRTPPCCDALINAGVTRVVIALQDPNPLVAGQGIARLSTAGIEVELLPPDHPAALESRELNIGFFSRMIRKSPWVRMKIAASIDGKTALNNGQSQWITSEVARADGHSWRVRASAVLTGIGTVVLDDPRLDVRLIDTPRQPHLVLVDSRLEVKLDAQLFIPKRQVLIYAAVPNEVKQKALEDLGASVIYLPGRAAGSESKVDLAAMLFDLGQREINELHVEAGHKLNGSLIREGLVDELLLYLAPKLIGQGADMAQFGPLTELSQALALEFLSSQLLGPDLRILARVTGRTFY